MGMFSPQDMMMAVAAWLDINMLMAQIDKVEKESGHFVRVA
jgi:hypothetical protein